MKILILLVALGATSQNLAQISDKQADSNTKQTPAEQSLESRLLDRAKLLYGIDVVKAVMLTTAEPPSVTEKAEPGIRPKKKWNNSPFGGSIDVETTKLMSQKGDVASGVILLEERDALYLDVAPCHPDAKVFTFHAPFAKKRVGNLRCNGKNLDKYSVAQR